MKISDPGRWQRFLLPVVFIAADYAAIVMAEWAALFLRNLMDFWAKAYYMIDAKYLYLWVPLFFIVSLTATGTYSAARPIVETIRRIFYAISYGLLASILLLYFLKAGALASRLFVLLFSVLALIFVYAERYVILKYFKLRHHFYEPVLLIGAGKTAERVLRFFDGDLGYRYDIVGILDDSPASGKIAALFPLLGRMDEAAGVAKRVGAGTVIITAPGLPREKLVRLIADVRPYVRNFSIVPDLIGTPMAGVEVDILFSEEILMLRLKNNLARRINRVIKRIFDIVLTVTGGLMLSPVIAILALAVANETGGSVIFSHRRVGRAGRPFTCYKFRTMVPDAEEKLKEHLAKNPKAMEEWKRSFKLTDDPRVTKLGRYLRRTSLDELPQIINVLKGDMSLVGPRPIVTEEIPRYGEFIKEYYMVRPGITGMWQTSGRSDTTYEERVAMDTWYVRNWSVWIDLVYLFKTVKIVLTQRGAY